MHGTLFSKHTMLGGTWPVNRIRQNTTHMILLDLFQPKSYSGLSTTQIHYTLRRGNLVSNWKCMRIWKAGRNNQNAISVFHTCIIWTAYLVGQMMRHFFTKLLYKSFQIILSTWTIIIIYWFMADKSVKCQQVFKALNNITLGSERSTEWLWKQTILQCSKETLNNIVIMF